MTVRAPRNLSNSAIRSEIAAARIQSFDRSGVANDPSTRIECQHPISATVEKEQPFAAIDGKSTWIGNAAVSADTRPVRA